MTHHDDISAYFSQEIALNYLVIFCGIISVILAVFFLTVIKYSLFKGMAYPLLIIGLMQMTLTANLLLKNDSENRKHHLKTTIKIVSEKIKTEELSGIYKLQHILSMLMIAETICILLGVFLWYYFRANQWQFWKGLGLGLTCQSAICLAFTIISSDRIQKYTDQLLNFTP